MRTLDIDDEEATVHRSISFWQRPDGTRAVFASYHREGARRADDAWPIEVDDKGTWGADDGARATQATQTRPAPLAIR